MSDKREQLYKSVAFYLQSAQIETSYRNYPIAGFMLVSALDPINFFGKALSKQEADFVRKFVHDCIDELSKMVTADISAADNILTEVTRTLDKQARAETVQSIVPKHLN